jgi:PAS domain-containing protein
VNAEDIVMGTAIAAYARGPSGMITAWNESAETLLGLPASKVVGKPCHAVVNGSDELGTYCCARCPSWRAASRGQPIHPYTLNVRHGLGRRIGVTVMILVVVDDDGLSLIHLVEPVDEPGVVVALWDDLDFFGSQSESSFQSWTPDMTFRELDIMRELFHGHDSPAIANRLALSKEKVWAHISSCVRKLETRPRAI